MSDARMRRTALLAWSCLLLFNVTASCQDSGKRLPLLLTDVQIVGSAPIFKGLELNALNTLLMFALSANPDLAVSASPISLPQSNNVARLASVIQTNGEVALWTGDLTRPGGKTIVLGPVVLGDAKGSRIEAPRLIADLVAQSLRDEFASTSPLAIRLGCFKADGKDAALVVAELRSSLASSFQRERLAVRDSGVGPDCEFDPSAGERDEAVVTANMQVTDGFKVTPYLSGRYYQKLPLPAFRGNEAAYLQSRGDYVGLLARAAHSYLGCPTEKVIDAAQVRDSGASAQIEMARKILQSRSCPYLAAALLEGSQANSNDVVIDIARAYRQAKEAGTAFQLLTTAVTNIQEPVDTRARAQYELALAAVDLQRFPEAMANFKAALSSRDFPDAHYQYAQTAYLIDDKVVAEEQIKLALGVNANDPTTRMLAARLALERVSEKNSSDVNAKYFDEALAHAKVAFEFAIDKTPVKSIVRDIAASAAQADPVTIANLRVAEEAFDLLVAGGSEDAESLLQRGRIRLGLVQFGDSKTQKKDALQDFQNAADIAKKAPTEDPQLQVIDLELAEAYLLDAQFALAQDPAERFLAEKRDPQSSASTYEPVAYLLRYAGEVLGARTDNREKRDAVLDDLKKYSKWPTLTITLTSGGKKRIEVPIARWRFDALDRYVCSLGNNPARNSVLNVSQSLQNQLISDAPKNTETCDVSDHAQ